MHPIYQSTIFAMQIAFHVIDYIWFFLLLIFLADSLWIWSQKLRQPFIPSVLSNWDETLVQIWLVWPKITYLKSAVILIFKLNTNRYGIGLPNEQFFIIIAQEAAKLWPVKVGGLKKNMTFWVQGCFYQVNLN